MSLQLQKNSVFRPDFETECRECGTLPTVIVEGHPVPHTNLCGRHFFNDRAMVEWEKWNEREEDTE